VEDNSDNADGDMLFVASNSEHHVDSELSMFVLRDAQDWFDTYRSINSSIVTMGNGAHCKITGIGNIRIKYLMV
jgi:hypothetical protein